MDLVGRAKRVRIYVNEGDLVGHQPSHVAIVEHLRREHAAGATVVRAVEGFGGAGEVHTERLVDIHPRLPLVIEWIDSPERVDRLLPRLKEMVARGLITVEDTDVVLYSPQPVRRVSARLTAGEVMSREVAAVTRDAPARHVVELMLGKLYRAVPVVDGGAPVGIITNSDLVGRGGLGVRLELLGSLRAPELHAELERLAREGRSAGEIMTPAPAMVQVGTPLNLVADLMAHNRLKRLPVVDERGLLVGMVSRLDLLRTVAEGFAGEEAEVRELGLQGDLPVGRVMRRDVPTVHPETPLPEVLQAVVATRLNRAVVVDGERRVVGLVTDAELLDRVTPSLRPTALRSLMHRLPFAHPRPAELEAEHHAAARRAGELMSTHVPTALESTPLREAITPMLRGREKLICVVDNERRLVGVVDRADLLRGLLGA
jgi:CBS domain-containing protein